MGFYQQVRTILRKYGLTDPTTDAYKTIIKASPKVLADIIHSGDMLDHDEKYLKNDMMLTITYHATPEIMIKVYNALKKYTPVFNEDYNSRATFDFRCQLHEKCGITHFMEDDFTYSNYCYHFANKWGTPFYYWYLKFDFGRIYLDKLIEKRICRDVYNDKDEIIERIKNDYHFTDEEKSKAIESIEKLFDYCHIKSRLYGYESEDYNNRYF